MDSFEPESSFSKSVADGSDVSRTAGFKRNVDDSFAEADSVVGAVVHSFDDVGTFAGEDLGEMV